MESQERGILLICFDRKGKGNKYMKQAQACVGSIREFTDLPIRIVSNMTAAQSDRLRQMKNEQDVEIHYVNAADKENRRYKTDMYSLTPFKVTMFTDTDTLVRRRAFLDGFEFVTKCDRDVALPFHHGEEMLNDVDRPAMVYQLEQVTHSREICYWCSGTIFWRRSKAAAEMFSRWHRVYSHRSMLGSDMLSLNIAMATTPACRAWPLGWTWSCQDEDESRAVICHIGGMAGRLMPYGERFTKPPVPLDRQRRHALIAGPYFGELGWEVGVWVPYVNFLAQKYGFDERIVYCQKGRGALYPFATEVKEFDAGDASQFSNSNWLDAPNRAAVAQFRTTLAGAAGVADAYCKHCTWVKHVYGDWFNRLSSFPLQRTPVRYRSSIMSPQDLAVVLAYRHLDRGKDKNTDIEQLNAICEFVDSCGLIPVVCGVSRGKDDALPRLHLKAANVVNQTTLGQLVDYYSAAKAVVGPSTGTMHLAAACGVPHVTWGGGTRGKECKARYLGKWNPFKTWCRYLGCEWKPNMDAVITAVREAIQQPNPSWRSE